MNIRRKIGCCPKLFATTCMLGLVLLSGATANGQGTSEITVTGTVTGAVIQNNTLNLKITGVNGFQSGNISIVNGQNNVVVATALFTGLINNIPNGVIVTQVGHVISVTDSMNPFHCDVFSENGSGGPIAPTRTLLGITFTKDAMPTPTLSEWAAIGMTLLLLTGGTIVFFGKRGAGTGLA